MGHQGKRPAVFPAGDCLYDPFTPSKGRARLISNDSVKPSLKSRKIQSFLAASVIAN